jgi:anti-sigma regulatory factor (Ser/Thr protein kinase)
VTFLHLTGLFGSDAELAELVVPALEAGVAAGEPTFLALGEHNLAVVAAATDLSKVRVVDGMGLYVRPAVTLRRYRDLLTEQLRAGARQMRVVGELHHPARSTGWDAWSRYEAVANHAFADFPVWGLCPYDTRTTPDHVLADVLRVHTHVAGAGGEPRPNPDFVEPRTFLAERARDPRPPAGVPPAVEVVDPSPGGARRVVAQLADRCRLAPADRDGLVASVAEVVGNARLHGRPPVLLQVWMGTGRIEVAVQDTGPGPRNPFAGLLPEPPGDGRGGVGLWLCHQLCSEVSMSSSPAGFTVRLRAASAAPW